VSRSLEKLLQSKAVFEREFAEWLVQQAAGGALIRDGDTYDKALAEAGTAWEETLSWHLKSDAPTVAKAELRAMKALRLMITTRNDLIERGWRLQPDGSVLPP
jgi:predicted RNase H-like HicB family nuclease